jgi:hypothetical protein
MREQSEATRHHVSTLIEMLAVIAIIFRAGRQWKFPGRKSDPADHLRAGGRLAGAEPH